MPDRASASADALAFATVPQLGRLLRRREVSALELARSALARLDGPGRRLHAVATLTAEVAEREARTADAALRRGDAGPLCGIPYGAKDLLDTAGIATRWGAPPYRDRVATLDATAIRRMRHAGAVLVAKLAMIELAGGGGYRDPAASIDGACLNPWSPTRWSGGSSSGSAAAVAAGILPLSLGSETGGSLVIPAAFCGVATLRPSFGTVSRYGAMPLGWSLDKVGPLAHTADDCGAVLGAIAGHDPADWTTEPWTYRPSRRREFRVGVLPNDFSEAPRTEAAFGDALRALRRLGMRTRPIALPDASYLELFDTVFSAETALAHRPFIEGGGVDELVDPSQREGLRRAAALPLDDYARAVRERERLTREVRALFGGVDALVAPTVLTEATALDQDLGVYRRSRRGGHAALGALAGLPSVSVPMGFGPAGLPLGLAIIGDRYAEATVLRIASLYQRETDWHLRRPAPVAA